MVGQKKSDAKRGKERSVRIDQVGGFLGRKKSQKNTTCRRGSNQNRPTGALQGKGEKRKGHI